MPKFRFAGGIYEGLYTCASQMESFRQPHIMSHGQTFRSNPICHFKPKGRTEKNEYEGGEHADTRNNKYAPSQPSLYAETSTTPTAMPYITTA